MFYEVFKSTRRYPPTGVDFDEWFRTPGVWRSNRSVLMAEQHYVDRMADDVLNPVVNKTLVLTGCSSGIGFATVVRWAQAGGIVHCVARERRVYDWHVDAASSDGTNVYVGAKSTGTFTDAVVALGLAPNATLEELMSEYEARGVTGSRIANDTFLLPQRHYPVYSGPIGVRPEVFDRIKFYTVDVRNATAVREWIASVRAATARVDYLCLNAQTEVGFDMQRDELKDYWEEAGDIALQIDDFLRMYPTRSHGTRHFSIALETRVGVTYLLSRLVAEFGEVEIFQHTTVQLISSIAATPAVTFGVGEKSYDGPHYGWFEYRMSKVYHENMVQMVARYGASAQVLSPGVFNTIINLGWIFAYMNLPFASDVLRLSPASDGSFYFPLTAEELHTIQTTVLGCPFIGGASYAAVQYIGLYERAKHTRQRHFHLSNPTQEAYGLVSTVIGDFGPTTTDSDIAECLDYGRDAHSSAWLARYKTAAPFSSFSENYARTSLDVLWRDL